MSMKGKKNGSSLARAEQRRRVQRLRNQQRRAARAANPHLKPSRAYQSQQARVRAPQVPVALDLSNLFTTWSPYGLRHKI